jgi:hypothetical protein
MHAYIYTFVCVRMGTGIIGLEFMRMDTIIHIHMHVYTYTYVCMCMDMYGR